MMPTQQLATLNAANCEVAFDNLTRQLYATDASPYQVVPLAVAFPKNVMQASSIIQAAAQAGVAVIPRGAGTGLSGGAIGEGLVVDFARHNREIWDFNKEAGTVRVGPGVVLDQLNHFLYPHGFRFGPDVATSSRATLGGMIANDSSGSHTPVYGTTGMHVNELKIVLADGKVTTIGPGRDTLPQQRNLVEDLMALNSLQIAERFPPGLLKRWPGYALARAAQNPASLLSILTGSEGTLAAILAAELKIVPLPRERGVGLLFFASVTEALQATEDLLELKPAAIEHIDRPLFDQTRGQWEFQSTRDLLELDTKPCESILIVEFFEHAKERLVLLKKKKLGLRQLILKTQAQADLVWSVRKAGLSLLTGCKGGAKPACFIEDAAVRPQDLPAYVNSLQKLMQAVGVSASYYGHAATGLLHVRPVLDLHRDDDRQKFRQIADEVSALVVQFKGSLAGEHGVGMARTEFLKEQVGPELYRLMKEIKHSFDPNNVFNPGKIISDGRYRIDRNLRIGTGRELPFEPQLAFAAKDGSFAGNLEQCNGCGGCLKQTPTMCPTFVATGDEIMSTRGRANAIRATLEWRGTGGDPLRSPEVEAALSNCLSCKACTAECPSNVNMALLKAELLHARIRRDGLKLRERLLSDVDLLGKFGCILPGVANFFLKSGSLRRILGKLLGFTLERPLPPFARTRFDHWFAKRPPFRKAYRGRVILWDDTFARYHEPEIGIAAVTVLETAGFEVTLPTRRKCCGRPAFSMGNLTEAAKLGRHNLALLNHDADETPIIFLEPSCYSMFVEDYRELKLPDADKIARRCILFEELIENLMKQEPRALLFNGEAHKIIIHAHCHAKSLGNTGYMGRLAERLPNRTVAMLDSGCCGMAGAFGMMESKYDLSLKIAGPLIEKIKHQPYGTVVVASGTSCRHQIQHLAPNRTQHMACVLADALA
jgi:FAD/FMN-containing dehydrogenase/Fe-S oxidoreductase